MSPTIHRKYKYFHSTVQTSEDIYGKSFMLNLFNSLSKEQNT